MNQPISTTIENLADVSRSELIERCGCACRRNAHRERYAVAAGGLAGFNQGFT